MITPCIIKSRTLKIILMLPLKNIYSYDIGRIYTRDELSVRDESSDNSSKYKFGTKTNYGAKFVSG